MARTRIISEKEEKQIVEWYKSGISVNALYRRYGYSWSVVKKVLAKYGVKERVYERKKRKISQEESESKARKLSEIHKGAPIDCDTEGKRCIYRATKTWHLCDYCALKGHSRGGSPHECVKYVFEKRGKK